jgi:photosystem II Psb28-2 protein
MSEITPCIEFFEGLPESLTNVSLRRSKVSDVRSVLLTFKHLQALEKFQSFTKKFTGSLRLIDEEGTISVEPSSLRIIWGGDEGDDLRGVECGFELVQEDHWERFMRFMERYAAANGMDYQSKKA